MRREHESSQARRAFPRTRPGQLTRTRERSGLIGEGNVGKSSLLAALRGEPFLENRETTHGIDIQSLEMVAADEGNIRFHAWDFGGQEIYRVTHQFFFSQDALFLLVWRPREGLEQSGVEFWLEKIARRVGGHGRVVLVSTYADEGRLAHVDLSRMKRQFGDLVVGHFAVDNSSARGMDDLKECLGQVALELRHVNDPIAVTWQSAREWLMGKKEPLVSRMAYEEECGNSGISLDAAETWLRLLAAFGEVVAFPDDPGLSDLIVRDPELLASAVSYLLENQEIVDCGGVASHKLISDVWGDHLSEASRAIYPFLLRLMEHHEISYRIDEKHSLIAPVVPHFGPLDVPWSVAPGDEVPLRAQFRMSADPVGLVSWLTCRFHALSIGVHWRSGVFLRDPDTRAEALIGLTGNTLEIEVRGLAPSELFTALRRDVDHLLRVRWPYVRYESYTMCSATVGCTGDFRFGALRSAVQDSNRQTVECSECFKSQSVARLLVGFDITERSAVGDGLLALAKGIDGVSHELALAREGIDRLQTVSVSGIRELAGVREIVGDVRRLVALVSADVPRLFSLTPEDHKAWDPRRLASSRYRLTLWCEAVGAEHPAGDGYLIQRPEDWFLESRGVLVVMARLLRLLPVVNGVGQVVLDGVDLEGLRSGLALMDEVGLAAFDLGVDTADRLPLAELPLASAFSPQGYEASMLKNLLAEIDPAGEFGGLSKVAVTGGEVLWICRSHREAQDPGLPLLGAC